MCCMQEAAAWGMASHVTRGVEGEGDGAAVVREAVALAGRSQARAGLQCRRAIVKAMAMCCVQPRRAPEGRTAVRPLAGWW